MALALAVIAIAVRAVHETCLLHLPPTRPAVMTFALVRSWINSLSLQFGPLSSLLPQANELSFQLVPQHSAALREPSEHRFFVTNEYPDRSVSQAPYPPRLHQTLWNRNSVGVRRRALVAFGIDTLNVIAVRGVSRNRHVGIAG
jgi:hypothetical protein